MRRKKQHGGKRKGAGAKSSGTACEAVLAVRCDAGDLAKARTRKGLADFIREKLRDFAHLQESS